MGRLYSAFSAALAALASAFFAFFSAFFSARVSGFFAGSGGAGIWREILSTMPIYASWMTNAVPP